MCSPVTSRRSSTAFTRSFGISSQRYQVTACVDIVEVPPETIAQDPGAYLPNLIDLGVLAVALKVDSFLHADSTEDKVTVAGPFFEAETPQQLLTPRDKRLSGPDVPGLSGRLLILLSGWGAWS